VGTKIVNISATELYNEFCGAFWRMLLLLGFDRRFLHAVDEGPVNLRLARIH